MGGGAVPGGAADAVGRGFLNEFNGSGHFRRQGDQQHLGDGVQVGYFIVIRLADKGGILRAAAFGVDERPFQVDAGSLGEFLVLHVFRHGGAYVFQHLGGQGEGCRQPGSDAFFHFAFRNGAEAFQLGVAGVAAAGAVAVDVNETGKEHAAFRIHDLVCGGEFAPGRIDGGNGFAFHFHGSPRQVDAGGDDACVFNECFHNNEWLLDGCFSSFFFVWLSSSLLVSASSEKPGTGGGGAPEIVHAAGSFLVIWLRPGPCSTGLRGRLPLSARRPRRSCPECGCP